MMTLWMEQMMEIMLMLVLHLQVKYFQALWRILNLLEGPNNLSDSISLIYFESFL